jgi:hypothetical protein|tara:strand:+ start:600 stop:896 length:297 start_codon:yes stop_codon:yes gene_type:complete
MEKYLDRPQDDGTRNSHPSYWRGRARGTAEILNIIKNIAEGKDVGDDRIASPVVEAARRIILTYKDTLTHASKKSTYLAKHAGIAVETAEKLAEQIKL